MRELIMNNFFQGLVPKYFKISLQTRELTFTYVFFVKKEAERSKSSWQIWFPRTEPHLNNEKEGIQFCLSNLYNLSKVR